MTSIPRRLLFKVDGLTNQDCAVRVEQAALQFGAVRYAGVSVSRGLMLLSIDDGYEVEEVLTAVRLLGFSVVPHADDASSP